MECFSVSNGSFLFLPNTPSLVVPVCHDHRRRSQPVREHADDAGSGAELQNGFPGQGQIRFSRADVGLVVAALTVRAMLHKVGAQQERTFPESLPADFLAMSADVRIGWQSGWQQRERGRRTSSKLNVYHVLLLNLSLLLFLTSNQEALVRCIQRFILLRIFSECACSSISGQKQVPPPPPPYHWSESTISRELQ